MYKNQVQQNREEQVGKMMTSSFRIVLALLWLISSCQVLTSFSVKRKPPILDALAYIPNLSWMQPILEKVDEPTRRKYINQWARLVFWQTATKKELQEARKIQVEFRKKADEHKRGLKKLATLPYSPVLMAHLMHRPRRHHKHAKKY